MKRRNTTPKFIARETVLFTVIGCVVLGLASLLVGLQMHRDSLLEASMRVNRMTAARAAVVAQKAADTVGLAGDVMGEFLLRRGIALRHRQKQIARRDRRDRQK